MNTIKNQLKEHNARKFNNIYFDFSTNEIFKKHLFGKYEKKRFSEITGFHLDQQGKTKEKHHRVTRAIVGTALLGNVGGVAGALTGGKKYDIVTKLDVIINFKDGSSWIEKFIQSDTKTSSFIYKGEAGICDGLMGTLKEIDRKGLTNKNS
ncbi:hypothetical protein [Fructilactobacillus lindneri]|uniref:hypothetical protein n=1 Tax=Fructilactobacillus lindneri TaxID=53444 RepID=UPI000CD41A48|nr:hypothetical protein [Fructilactobacillus lindneri]POH04352.1 hypothetical protein BGL33_06980 [Fructilactobacillus lindneri]